MFEQIETFLVAHEDFITLIFTLVLILITLVYTIITRLSVRELKRQCLFQEWVCLQSTFHSNQLALFEFKSEGATTTNEQQGIVLDEAVASLEHTIRRTKERIVKIEDSLWNTTA